MLCALGELLEAPPFRSMEDWPGQKLGEQARRGASRGFDRNGMRFNIDGPILLLCLRDQSAERPCMDSTLITPNGWRKAATASKDRQTDTPLPASGLIASDILRSCTEGRRQIWSGGDGVVELLVLTSASLGLLLLVPASAPFTAGSRGCCGAAPTDQNLQTLLLKHLTNVCRSPLLRRPSGCYHSMLLLFVWCTSHLCCIESEKIQGLATDRDGHPFRPALGGGVRP
jgi:hypothetical protein